MCPPECGRSRETLQTTLESFISRFWKCLFFNIFKNIVKSIGFPWIWSKSCSGPNISTNNENLRYIIRDIFYLQLYFVLTKYEAIPTIIRGGVPISPSAPQNPMSDPLTGDRWAAPRTTYCTKMVPSSIQISDPRPDIWVFVDIWLPGCAESWPKHPPTL